MTNWPTFNTGLNPYGLTYHLGLQGRGTNRENPNGKGLKGFIELAEEIGVKALEIFDPWIEGFSESEMRELKDQLDSLGITPIVSGGLVSADSASLFRSARLLGADTIRVALTNVLCGGRAEREDWDALKSNVATNIQSMGEKAADQGVIIAIENHQDFTSSELVEFCGLVSNIGITYDTGNSFPVGEAPLDFTRNVAPYVRHLHLKDYKVQFTPEGFRLIRCAIGDGAVPFPELFSILGEYHKTMTAVLEPGALEMRHVKLFNPDWWNGYSPKSAHSLAACLLAAQTNRLSENTDYRTPWEMGADEELVDYELAMIRKSATNMKSLGIL